MFNILFYLIVSNLNKLTISWALVLFEFLKRFLMTNLTSSATCMLLKCSLQTKSLMKFSKPCALPIMSPLHWGQCWNDNIRQLT